MAADVGGWPGWMSTVRTVAATPEGPVVIEARLLGFPLYLLAEIEAEPPGRVAVHRIPLEPGDAERFELTLELVPQGDGTRATAAIDAELDVPRFVPLPRAVGDQVAGRLLADLEGAAA